MPLLMKPIYTLLFLCFGLFGQLWAQPKPHQKRQDLIFYIITHNQFLNTPTYYETSWQSNEHRFQFMWETKPAKFFTLAYGLGYTSSNTHHNLALSTEPETGETEWNFLSSNSYERNYLNRKAVELPIEFRFRFRSPKDHVYRAYLGGSLGYQFANYSRLTTNQAKTSHHRLKALSPLQYGVYVKLGYRVLSLFAYYGFSPIFQNQTNTPNAFQNINQFSLGIAIGG